MKFGKRIAALACAGVLCLSLTACDEMNGQDQEIHNTYADSDGFGVFS